jgi:hypothetical protein
MVFLNSPHRKASKNVLKKDLKKKSAGGWVWDLANTRGGPSIFFAGPSAVESVRVESVRVGRSLPT